MTCGFCDDVCSGGIARTPCFWVYFSVAVLLLLAIGGAAVCAHIEIPLMKRAVNAVDPRLDTSLQRPLDGERGRRSRVYTSDLW